MNKSDIEKFLSQNLTCEKSKNYLKKIEHEYGYEYKLSTILGPPKMYNLYELILKNPQVINFNDSNLEDLTVQYSHEGNELTGVAVKGKVNSHITLYNSNIQNNNFVLCGVIFSSFPTEEDETLNFNIKFSPQYVETPEAIQNFKFGENYNTSNFNINDFEFVNIGNIAHGSYTKNEDIKLFNEKNYIDEGDLRDNFGFIIHVTTDKKDIIYNICIWRLHPTIKILLQQFNIRQKIANYDGTYIFKYLRLYWVILTDKLLQQQYMYDFNINLINISHQPNFVENFREFFVKCNITDIKI